MRVERSRYINTRVIYAVITDFGYCAHAAYCYLYVLYVLENVQNYTRVIESSVLTGYTFTRSFDFLLEIL